MFVPRILERKITNSVLKIVNNFGEIATLNGYYEIIENRLVLALNKATMINGRSEVVSIVINL